MSATGALADEQLVLPFRCQMVAGKPVLTPSDQAGHRVLGARDQKKVTSCSPVDPKRCLQWTAFKFDLDCGGTRVAWLDVVANATEFTRRRTWLQDGRLRVQTTPPRNKRLDDYCARNRGLQSGDASLYCAERTPVEAPTAIDMPPGFAPMIGLDGVFFGEPNPGSPRTAAAAPSPAAKQLTKVAAAPVAPPLPVVAPPLNAPAKQGEPSAPAPDPKPEAAAAPPPVAAQQDRAASEEPVSPVPVSPVETAASSLRVAAPSAAVPEPPAASEPTVLNAPPAPAPVASQSAAEPATTALPAITPDQPAAVDIADNAAAPPAIAAQPVELVQAADTTTDAPDNSGIYVVVAVAGGALAMTLLAIGWLGHAKPDLAAARDVASVNFGGPAAEARNALALTDPVQAVSRSATALGGAQHPAGGLTAASLGDRIPTSKDEALGILGMGVSADGSLMSLKKIVDGLRMNWHPDLARDDLDRQIRELRLKQINAAWEILGGRTAEV